MNNRLCIFVSDDCANCEATRQLAVEMRRRYTSLKIDLINLSDPDTICPDNVFAVPTFMYDGRVIFLGNPSPQELEAFLQRTMVEVHDQ